MITLETTRLLIRRLEKADIPALVALWSDKDITRHLGGRRDPERVRTILESELTEGQADNLGLWPVIEKSTGELIGDCGLLRKDVDGQPEIELNYVIAKRVWGRGYATEAAAAVAGYAFTTLGCKRLIALIDPANAASERVATKVGLRHEKDTLRPDGTRRRVYVLAFPLKVRALIENNRPPVHIYPYREATDDVVRQRRGHFGDYILFASAIVERKGRVVVIQQRAVPHAEPGVWFFPGGGVGREEAITDAAVREVKEETGLDVELLEPLGVLKSGRQARTRARSTCSLSSSPQGRSEGVSRHRTQTRSQRCDSLR